eukprot:g49716.t1
MAQTATVSSVKLKPSSTFTLLPIPLNLLPESWLHAITNSTESTTRIMALDVKLKPNVDPVNLPPKSQTSTLLICKARPASRRTKVLGSCQRRLQRSAPLASPFASLRSLGVCVQHGPLRGLKS